VDFESATPSVVKSIKQRDFLNAWLRLYAKRQQPPTLAEYQPERMTDELNNLAQLRVDATTGPARFIFERESSRMASAYGHASEGRCLGEYLGPDLAAIVLPVYFECVSRELPVYTIFMVNDTKGRIVAYERLLLPFFDGGEVSRIIASHCNISEDGNFEIKGLMRTGASLPRPKLCAVVDRDLFHQMPGRVAAGDVIEHI
jgi:hypothetical protein